MKNEMLYLISGRNTYSDQLSRKFYEMDKCFRAIVETKILSGGDFQRKDRTSYHHLTQAKYHSKWYRKNLIMRCLAESYGEIRSIRHNIQTYNFLKTQNDTYRMIWERSTGLHCAGILYAKNNNIPSVLEWKDHLIKDYWSFFKPIVKYIERWKNKNSTYIVVESNVLKQQLVQEGVDPDKIYITYNAVNPEEFKRDNTHRNEVREQFNFTEDDLIVGYVGSYAFYHDSIRMIKAAKVLQYKGVKNIKWLLVGDGKEKYMCDELAEKEGLIGKSIFMVPRVAKEKVPYYLSAMDVTILPGSTDIICPIKVMEYMAAESVVLVPDYACNREIIDGTKNGLLFNPFDENSIVDKLCQLNNNRALIKEIGAEARRYVSDNLTWDMTYGSVMKALLSK